MYADQVPGLQTRHSGASGVDPLCEPELVPKPPYHNESRCVGQVPGAVPESERSRGALHMGPRRNMVVSYRLGASRRWGIFLPEVPATYGSRRCLASSNYPFSAGSGFKAAGALAWQHARAGNFSN